MYEKAVSRPMAHLPRALWCPRVYPDRIPRDGSGHGAACPTCSFTNRSYGLLPVFLGSFANRWTGLGKILRAHDRPQGDLCVESEKPRLGDRRNLR